jgi:hypothetical protein
LDQNCENKKTAHAGGLFSEKLAHDFPIFNGIINILGKTVKRRCFLGVFWSFSITRKTITKLPPVHLDKKERHKNINPIKTLVHNQFYYNIATHKADLYPNKYPNPIQKRAKKKGQEKTSCPHGLE